MHKLDYLLLETPWQNPLATVYAILEAPGRQTRAQPRPWVKMDFTLSMCTSRLLGPEQDLLRTKGPSHQRVRQVLLVTQLLLSPSLS